MMSRVALVFNLLELGTGYFHSHQEWLPNPPGNEYETRIENEKKMFTTKLPYALCYAIGPDVRAL